MAIHLEANYTKKLGLPGYSSHQYSVTLKTEISDLTQVPTESSRLHNLLQSCVDREIQKTGFLPVTNGANLGQNALALPIVGRSKGAEAWACSAKQKDLILKIVEEQGLDKNQVEALAQDRFGKSVPALCKPEASELIDELLGQTNGGFKADQRQTSNGRPPTTNWH